MMEFAKRLAKIIERVGGRAMAALRRAFGEGKNRERLGYYACLAVLLTILGSASYAYRVRQGQSPSAQDDAPRTVLAVRTPIPTQTPEPTPEPMRWLWPLKGDTVGDYSPAAPVWSRTLEQWQTHPALDIAGSPGEAVCACADGMVLDVWEDRLWGKAIALEHADGFQSTYAGLNTLKLVEVGDSVEAGEVISSVGDTAACEADLSWHLHFELTKDGEPVDFTSLVS